jgi:hypothetical protein
MKGTVLSDEGVYRMLPCGMLRYPSRMLRYRCYRV